MVILMPKRVVVYAVLTTWMLGMPGCVSRSEYDTKMAELNKQAEQLAKAEEEASQLHKDLDAANIKVGKAEQANKDAEAKIKSVELENTGLKEKAVSNLNRNR